MSKIVKLSSIHILKIIEQVGRLGWIELPVLPSDGLVSFSQGFRGLFGIDETEPERLESVARAIQPRERSLFVEDVAVLRRRQEAPPRIYRLSTQFMPPRYVSLIFTPVLGDDGEIAKFLGLARDVSAEEVVARHKIQNAHRIDMLMTYFGAACVWSADEAGQLFERYASGNLAGVMPKFDPISPSSIHPEDRKNVLTELDIAMSGKEAFSVPMRLFGADGVPRKYIYMGFPITEDGKVVEWWGVINEENASLAMKAIALDHAITVTTGATLRAICALIGWTHDELAKQTGISRTTIYRMVSTSAPLLGQFKSKTIETVLQIFIPYGIRFFADKNGNLAILSEAVNNE
ncbi:PAS domain-containing protein [Asticcacaulis sp. SL142]|uniref:PAS domain-containing protein n=1 Tax=Asticcacaulis sp. SL142 TaxID=2995155 RepID=UPI00226CB80E|nr:PAS domain-containing protein [Asticcacaulis sp. SL142]WAC48254.1 PAS domain-containing protein [Asticcacaulis sp. SL142]